jgi:hypothetical protein
MTSDGLPNDSSANFWNRSGSNRFFHGEKLKNVEAAVLRSNPPPVFTL